MMRSAHVLFFTAITHAEPSYRLQPVDARLASPAVNEASGLAASPTRDGFLWMINDSGGTAEIHLAETDGTARGAVRIEGLTNVDWEDLAAFRLNGTSYLLIADTGDNSSSRSHVSLFIIREPALPAAGETLAGVTPLSWRIDFTYEDGPRDCEAVAVDPGSNSILLVSKRTEPPVVYQLPLETSELAVAKKIGTTQTRSPGIIPMPFAHQPTGMDISRCGSKAALITYSGTFLFVREKMEPWEDAFAKQPAFLGSHKLPQAEAVAFCHDGASILAVSEKAHSPIVRYGSED